MARVLYIDDSHLGRTVARLSLVRAGHEVIEAPDGKAGIEAAETHDPDCVVCALDLPVKSGLEVIARIGDGRSAPPVIMIVSCARESTVAKCRKAGAHSLLDRAEIDRSLASRVDDAMGRASRAAA